LSEANRIMGAFIENIKEAYGENVFPSDRPQALCFEPSVDENGRITSALPSLHEIGNAKGYWSNIFRMFLRPRSK
jgi:hypothetical protein